MYLDFPRLTLILRLIKPCRGNIMNEELEEFLATIAHDLKNPLGAIFGYADTLLDTGLGKDLSKDQRDILMRIRDTAARSIELVVNYQHLVKFGSLTHEGLLGQCDLNDALARVVEYQWREKPDSPDLQVVYSKDTPVVSLERVHVERIFTNLLSNALKFTPSRGTIKIKTYSEDQLAFTEFFNSGSFIPESEYSLLFKRYGRASNAKNISGSGLGLFIVKRILDIAGGTISVQSEPHTGTTFKVGFPVNLCL